jgi:hypothetical protein
MEEEVTGLLREAVWLLRIMARPQITELRERFSSGMLASAKRREMWELMDGNRSLSDIGRKVGTSTEAVRQFLGEVEGKWPDLVEVNKSGAGIYPRRLI